MKRLLFFVLLCFTCHEYAAQLAIVNDPDGYVNVRAGKGKDFSVVDTLRSGRLVAVFDTADEWLPVVPRMPYKDGYRDALFVHRSRLQRVENLDRKKQHELLLPVFSAFVRAKKEDEKRRYEGSASATSPGLEKERGPVAGDYFEEALVSAAAAWQQQPDSILMQGAFEALAWSSGSASERRTDLMARIARARPELYRRMACRFPDWAHDELVSGASVGFEMNIYPGGIFTAAEEKRTMEILFRPCSERADENPDALDSVRNKVARKEIESLIYEGIELEEVPLPGKLHLQKSGTAAITGNTAFISAFGYRFDLTVSAFEKEKHVLHFSREHPDVLLAIEGNRVWGTDGGIPVTKLSGLKVTFGGHYYTLPGGPLYQPGILQKTEGSFQYVSVFRSADQKRVYLRMYGGDGAGGYVCVWVFRDGKYQYRVVEHGF